jgi:hypothetical protein
MKSLAMLATLVFWIPLVVVVAFIITIIKNNKK